MPAKIITLSQKDQDLLRVALLRATGTAYDGANSQVPHAVAEVTERIKELRARLL